MSISLTLISKSDKKYKIGEIVSLLSKTVNDNYTGSEKEAYVSNHGKSCLSILFQAKKFNPQRQSEMIVQNVGAKGSNLILVKKTVELEKMDDFAKILDNLTSPFVVLELTRMISDLEKRPPWILSKGQLVFPVGGIGKYFVETHDSPYKNDVRGLQFAKDFPNKDQSEIATAYFDHFVNKTNIKGLVDPEKTGLSHFSTIVSPEKGKIKFSFVQNGTRSAKYFFEPDVMFCSNELVARSIRRAIYPNQDIPIKGSLRFYETAI